MTSDARQSNDSPVGVMQFYYSYTFPYLIERNREEIRHRLSTVPKNFRRIELEPSLAPLGETSGDDAWGVT